MGVHIFRQYGVWHVFNDGGVSLCGVPMDTLGRSFIPRYHASLRDAWAWMDAQPESSHCPECMVCAASAGE